MSKDLFFRIDQDGWFYSGDITEYKPIGLMIHSYLGTLADVNTGEVTACLDNILTAFGVSGTSATVNVIKEAMIKMYSNIPNVIDSIKNHNRYKTFTFKLYIPDKKFVIVEHDVIKAIVVAKGDKGKGKLLKLDKRANILACYCYIKGRMNNKTKIAMVTQETISEALGIGRRTVIDSVDELTGKTGNKDINFLYKGNPGYFPKNGKVQLSYNYYTLNIEEYKVALNKAIDRKVNQTKRLVQSQEDNYIDVEKMVKQPTNINDAEVRSMADGVITFLNKVANKNFKVDSFIGKHYAKFSELVRKGYTLDDFNRCVDFMVGKWKGTQWDNGINPQNLLVNNFEKNLKWCDDVGHTVTKEEDKPKKQKYTDKGFYDDETGVFIEKRILPSKINAI